MRLKLRVADRFSNVSPGDDQMGRGYFRNITPVPFSSSAADDIDSTDLRRSLEQIVGNFESCKAQAKQNFDCKTIMGTPKGF